MGTLLTKVEHIKGRGLVGFPKLNEEVLLDVPKPGFLKVEAPVGGSWKYKELESHMEKAYNEAIDNILKEEDICICLEERKGEFINFEISQLYNAYPKRKD